VTDRKISITVSKDGNHNFTNKRETTLGELGEYSQRVRFLRFGRARQFTLQTEVTSPIVVDILGAVVSIDEAGA
jgi:hypothetical protein